MGMFSHLTDEDVTDIFHRTAGAVVKVHGMSPEERNTPKGKGNAPISAVPLSAHFFHGAAREMEERGLLPKGWWDE